MRALLDFTTGMVLATLGLLVVVSAAYALGPFTGGVPWTPVEMAHLAQVRIVGPETFEALRTFYGVVPEAGAFAQWDDDTCFITLRTDSLNLFAHELRHCQQGAYHP